MRKRKFEGPVVKNSEVFKKLATPVEVFICFTDTCSMVLLRDPIWFDGLLAFVGRINYAMKFWILHGGSQAKFLVSHLSTGEFGVELM